MWKEGWTENGVGRNPLSGTKPELEEEGVEGGETEAGK